MTLPRLKEFTTYWEKNPPAHIAIKTFVSGGGAQEAHPLAEVGDLGMLISGATPTF